MTSHESIDGRVESIFAAVSEASPADRHRLLIELCAGDETLRAEVASLLEFADGGRGVLDTRAFPDASLLLSPLADAIVENPQLPTDRRIGQYTVTGFLGAGGMGVAYVAEQDRPRRTVAIKVIRRGMDGGSLVRRFEHEAELLGRLHHPGIAQIFEAGAAIIDGVRRPFIAMELVRGPTIAAYVRERDITVGNRLALVAQICDAVEHAHQKGIIHRDLKPANILVDLASDHPQPKILDFGVARATNADLNPTTIQTGVGQLIGTLQYMSPEQVSGDPGEVDTRSDVYALGVILFELLTGGFPHNLTSRAIPDAARVIVNEEPRRLGTVNRSLRGDIDTIVGKAIERDKTRRYQSAAALGEDLRRHLTGKPIHAKHDSALYVIGKQIRRYRGIVAAASVFVAGLAAFAVYASVQAGRERLARQRADDATAIAQRAQSESAAQAKELRRNLYMSDIGFAQAAYLIGDADRMRRRLDQCPEDLRGWEWRYLMSRSDESIRVVRMPVPALTSYYFSPDHRHVVVRSGVDGIGLINTETGVSEFSTHGRPAVLSGGFNSITGSFLVSLFDGSFEIWDKNGATAASVPPSKVPEFILAVSPDGRRLAAIAEGGAARIRDMADGSDIRALSKGSVTSVDFGTTGSRAVYGTAQGDAYLIDDVSTPERRMPRPHAEAVRDIEFSHDGKRVASAGNDGAINVWELATDRVEVFRPHLNKAACVAWSPDDRWLASAGTESLIRITDAQSGATVRTLAGHATTIQYIEFLGSSSELLTASLDGTIRWWSNVTGSTELTRMMPEGQSIAHVMNSIDGRSIFLVGSQGFITRADSKSLETLATGSGQKDGITSIGVSRDGTWVATPSVTGTTVVRDADTLEPMLTIESDTGRTIDAIFASDSRWLATAGDNAAVRIWSLPDGAHRRDIPFGTGAVTAMALVGDDLLAVGSLTGEVAIIDPESGSIVRTLDGMTLFAWHFTLSPDGRTLAAACDDSVVYLWDLDSKAPPRLLRGHQRGAEAVAFSPDGARLVTGGWDNTVRLWDVASGQQLITLRGHIASVDAVLFTADGDRVLSACSRGAIKLWDAGT